MLEFPPSPQVGQIFPDPVVEGRGAWMWDGLKWRSASSGEVGIEDAPGDGRLFGRMDEDWAEALPITGGMLQGSLTINGELQTNIIRLGNENHWLWWTGSDYLLGGSGVPWTTGNMPALAGTDGRITSVHFDGGSHMNYVVDGWLVNTLVNYSDIDAAYAHVNANYLSAGGLNNYANAVRLLLAGGGAVSGALAVAATASGAATTIARSRWVQYHVPNVGWGHGGRLNAAIPAQPK
jgi:hypothetical protein